ncbi:MAG: DUF5665 domain-containing protein [Candidatus Peregrinibacteria bacterium]
MPNKTEKNPSIQLAQEVKTLSKEIARMKSLDYLQVFRHPVKFMWFAFLKGLMVGFGSVLGASVLVGIFVYLVAQISFVPVIGGFVEDVIEQVGITSTQGSDTPTVDLNKQIEDKKKEIEEQE